MKIIHLDEIKKTLEKIDVLPAIEKGFIAYSNGEAVMPPVGELLFSNPPGDVHIKYGYIKNDDCYVVKIASGFYENSKIGLPSSNGVMLLFNKKTGELLSVLLDEGYLTDVRTAIAGAIVAKFLAPKKVNAIGIVGTGTQAKLQLQYLKNIVSCNSVIVFGRNMCGLEKFQKEMISNGFNIHHTQNIEEITSACNLIVTTTPAESPLLFSHQIKKGSHITAIGADSPNKQELQEKVFALADIVVADSITQCVERGDISHAIKKKIIEAEQIVELGNIISGKSKGRTDDNQITIADLTGLAVQDISIAKSVYKNVNRL